MRTLAQLERTRKDKIAFRAKIVFVTFRGAAFVPLSNTRHKRPRKWAKIDAADVDAIRQLHWQELYANRSGQSYATAGVDAGRIYMHRFIEGLKGADVPKHLHVDHINLNTLDNRRKNLRAVEPVVNVNNSIKGCGPSGIKGVTKTSNNQFVAKYRGKKLGVFATLSDAAKAIDSAKVALFGKNMATNFASVESLELSLSRRVSPAKKFRTNGWKLNQKQVEQIVALRVSGMKLIAIGAMFNVSEATVSRIAGGITWAHVTGIRGVA